MADSYVFGLATLKMFDKQIDLMNDDIKVMLLNDSATPNQHSNEFISDLNADEITGSGYDAGGITLSNKTVTYSAPTMTFDADDITWSASTITNALYAVAYDYTGLTTTSPVICYVDFGTVQTSSSSDLILEWDSSGIFTATV